jgi:type II secretory pathway pseudopilin PulG
MSKRTERDAVVIGGEPRVNLLPPEVALRKKARSARRGLVALVIIVLLAVAGGYGVATVRALAAEAELAVSQARTAELLAEQLQYGEVTTVSGNVQAVKDARTVAVSTEVLWNEYYTKIRDLIPVDTSISSFVVDGRAPWEPDNVPAGPLRQPRVATITFMIASAGPFPVQPFVAQISKIPGFVDVTADVITKDGESYTTQFTYNLGADALSGRFPAGEEASN